MKQLVQLFSCITGLVVLAGCQTNQQGAEAWYDVQRDMVRPLVEITGATNPDGTYQEVHMRFGRMAIYAPQDAEQFVEDDRAVRVAETVATGAIATAAIVETGRSFRSGVVRETTTTTTTEGAGNGE